MTQPQEPSPDVRRRSVLRGAAVGGVMMPLLVACGGGGSDASTSPGSDAADSDGSDPAEASDSPSESASEPKAEPGDLATSKVAIGGGTILKGKKVVVTQPVEGTFKAFTAVCTHTGCLVGSVEDGEIVCPCHGSRFSIEDGSVLSGPAGAALATKQISVADGEITLA